MQTVRYWLVFAVQLLAAALFAQDAEKVERQLNDTIDDLVIHYRDISYFPRVLVRDINANERQSDWWVSEVPIEDQKHIASMLDYTRENLHNDKSKGRLTIEYVTFDLAVPRIKTANVDLLDLSVSSAQFIFPSQMTNKWIATNGIEDAKVVVDTDAQLAKEPVCSLHYHLKYFSADWRVRAVDSREQLARQSADIVRANPMTYTISLCYRFQDARNNWSDPRFLCVAFARRDDLWVPIESGGTGAATRVRDK